ncbi:hypothetical protein [Pendulispora albinea]|uniref:Uncharacterized protein n=1 Tax=Pendulispora albinea TaxID=2741071 RepID=A0ABZ2LVJ0_9BACT
MMAVDSVFTVTPELMQRDYGIEGDGKSNDFPRLKQLFDALNRGTYKGAPLDGKRVVVDFGSSRTYCALYDPDTFEGSITSDRCAYRGRTSAGAALDAPSVPEAVLALNRGGVQLTVGSDTILDASISIAGALTGKYLGTYTPPESESLWQDAGETFAFLSGERYITPGQGVLGEEVAGKVVAVQLARPSEGNAAINQSGIHLSEVSSYRFDGDRIYLTLAEGLRFPTPRPKFSRVDATKIKRSGFAVSTDRKQLALALPAARTPEHLEHIKPKTIVRFENLTGRDSVFSNSAYFEYNRVTKVARNGDQLILGLESPLAYEYGDMWLMQPPFLDGIRIVGGSVDSSVITRLRVSYAQNVEVTNLHVRQMGLSAVYDLTLDRLTGRIPASFGSRDADTVFGFSHCRKGQISNLDASGARSVHDNANVKLMSPLDISLRAVTSYESATLGDEGTYAFFTDFYYTPYNGWAQNLNIDGIVAERPSNHSRAVWLTGVRGSAIRAVKTDGLLYVSKSGGPGPRERNTWNDLVATQGIHVEESVGQSFQDFTASHLRVTKSQSIVLRGGFLDDSRYNYDRCLWIHASKDVQVNGLLFYNGGKFCDGRSVFLQGSSDITLSRVSDLERYRKAPNGTDPNGTPPRGPFASIYFHKYPKEANCDELYAAHRIHVAESSLNFARCPQAPDPSVP